MLECEKISLSKCNQEYSEQNSLETNRLIQGCRKNPLNRCDNSASDVVTIVGSILGCLSLIGLCSIYYPTRKLWLSSCTRHGLDVDDRMRLLQQYSFRSKFIPKFLIKMSKFDSPSPLTIIDDQSSISKLDLSLNKIIDNKTAKITDNYEPNLLKDKFWQMTADVHDPEKRLTNQRRFTLMKMYDKDTIVIVERPNALINDIKNYFEYVESKRDEMLKRIDQLKKVFVKQKDLVFEQERQAKGWLRWNASKVFDYSKRKKKKKEDIARNLEIWGEENPWE